MIAAGGFADGRGLVAALALGAGGINMGTRFLATVEAPIHNNVKRRLVEATALDTYLIFQSLRNTSRVARNAVSSEVVSILDKGEKFDAVRELVAGARGRKVFETGELDLGVWSAGRVQGLIRDIPTVAELISRIVFEAEELIAGRLAGALNSR